MHQTCTVHEWEGQNRRAAPTGRHESLIAGRPSASACASGGAHLNAQPSYSRYHPSTLPSPNLDGYPRGTCAGDFCAPGRPCRGRWARVELPERLVRLTLLTNSYNTQPRRPLPPLTDVRGGAVRSQPAVVVEGDSKRAQTSNTAVGGAHTVALCAQKLKKSSKSCIHTFCMDRWI